VRREAEFPMSAWSPLSVSSTVTNTYARVRMRL
jgi:hypothetical protein